MIGMALATWMTMTLKLIHVRQADALAFEGTLDEIQLGKMMYLGGSQQPAWGRSREFDITTRSLGRNGLSQSTTGDLEDEEGESDEVMLSGRKKRKGT